MLNNAEIIPSPAESDMSVSHPSTIQDLDSTAPTYRDRLRRWAIARILPEKPPEIMGRFRSRSDADGYLRILARKFPGEKLLVIVDK